MNLGRIAARVCRKRRFAILFGPSPTALGQPIKKWKFYSIKIDRTSDPFFPGFDFKGKYIDKSGNLHDTEFEIATELGGGNADFEYASGYDIWRIVEDDSDAMGELWDILAESQDYKDIANAVLSPNAKQEKLLEEHYTGTQDHTIDELIDAG